MSNAEKNYVEVLSKESAKQRKTIMTFSIINTILLVAIAALVIINIYVC